MNNPAYKYNDGGKPETVKGKGDCVVRAITIASGLPYTEVADALRPECRKHNKLIKAGKRTRHRGKNSTTAGIHKEVYHSWLLSNGWTWTPTMFIGQGCKVHLTKSELPKGRIIAKVSRHLVACIDGVVQDTYDCTRGGKRCVYGYYSKPEGKELSYESDYQSICDSIALEFCELPSKHKTKIVKDAMIRSAIGSMIRIVSSDNYSTRKFRELVEAKITQFERRGDS